MAFRGISGRGRGTQWDIAAEFCSSRLLRSDEGHPTPPSPLFVQGGGFGHINRALRSRLDNFGAPFKPRAVQCRGQLVQGLDHAKSDALGHTAGATDRATDGGDACRTLGMGY
eukprot:gnl/TRDRNA2_/TRDRNA2_181245_c0_seq1.p1 gnl/TRDRNA2_/TRDRNA2_181245_c0~~gnl/TRDRNA2_/TRDRNA2_181245_c0_seq1.p1  ORF type:complete len:113 (+),score=3.75 gnl/TRDRNA2_/TRDRNA2_181245_c0_seq1:394-732(+)